MPFLAADGYAMAMPTRKRNPSEREGGTKKDGQGGFWSTLPGILTGVAAVGTAAATLIGVLFKAGVFSKHVDPPPPPSHGSLTVVDPATKPIDIPPLVVVPAKQPATAATAAYPRELKVTGAARAGEYQFKVLNARLVEYGTDSAQAKTLMLRLRIRESFDAKFGTGYFSADGFRLMIGEQTQSPKDSPIQNIDHGTSQDGEVTFIVPEATPFATLRVGYYEGQRTDIALKLAPD
jgi:hypothetical protein